MSKVHSIPSGTPNYSGQLPVWRAVIFLGSGWQFQCLRIRSTVTPPQCSPNRVVPQSRKISASSRIFLCKKESIKCSGQEWKLFLGGKRVRAWACIFLWLYGNSRCRVRARYFHNKLRFFLSLIIELRSPRQSGPQIVQFCMVLIFRLRESQTSQQWRPRRVYTQPRVELAICIPSQIKGTGLEFSPHTLSRKNRVQLVPQGLQTVKRLCLHFSCVKNLFLFSPFSSKLSIAEEWDRE